MAKDSKPTTNNSTAIEKAPDLDETVKGRDGRVDERATSVLQRAPRDFPGFKIDQSQSAFQIPKSVKDTYAEAGWKLRFISIVDPKTRGLNEQKLFKFLNTYHGAPVTPEEMLSINKQYYANFVKHQYRDENNERPLNFLRLEDQVLIKYPMVIADKLADAVIAESAQGMDLIKQRGESQGVSSKSSTKIAWDHIGR